MNIKCFLIEDTGKYGPARDVTIDGKINGTSSSPIYRRVDTGEEFEFHGKQVPVGAIWRATWFEEFFDKETKNQWCGTDGKCYVVMTPEGEWIIDSRASNCTRKDDNDHKCWCRHGEAPNFTVNKVGNTCSAGAGSIQIGNYHGFLINGELTNC